MFDASVWINLITTDSVLFIETFVAKISIVAKNSCKLSFLCFCATFLICSLLHNQLPSFLLHSPFPMLRFTSCHPWYADGQIGTAEITALCWRLLGRSLVSLSTTSLFCHPSTQPIFRMTASTWPTIRAKSKCEQGVLKGEVSLYCWPPVWLVWISLFCK